MQPIPLEENPGLQVLHFPYITGSATAQLGIF